MPGRLGLWIGLWLLVAQAKASPAVPAAHGAEAQQARALRSKVAKLLKISGLPKDLRKEAQSVDAEAAKAVNGSSASLEQAQREYSAFVADVMKYEKQARAAVAGAAKPAQPAAESQAATLADHAEELEPVLEARVKRVLAHILADKGLTAEEEADRKQAADRLQVALNKPAGTVVERVVNLHNALQATGGYLTRRTQRLGAEQARLSNEVEAQTTSLLYRMLKQRRTLPMQSQFALLRREQFANSSYAQQLLKSHRTGSPLYSQLEELVPAPMAAALKSAAAGLNGHKRGHLEAAGSGGMVHIVSSRMKNEIQVMAKELQAGRDSLAKIAAGGGGEAVTAHQRQQVKGILVKLDGLLAKVKDNHDLSAQLEAMDEVQGNLTLWMKNITA